jgi:hypothetical protein
MLDQQNSARHGALVYGDSVEAKRALREQACFVVEKQRRSFSQYKTLLCVTRMNLFNLRSDSERQRSLEPLSRYSRASTPPSTEREQHIFTFQANNLEFQIRLSIHNDKEDGLLSLHLFDSMLLSQTLEASDMPDKSRCQRPR